MESVRKYTSVRMDAYSSSGRALDKAGGFGGTLNSLFDRFEKTGRTGDIFSIRNSEEDAISEIRARCINFLIRLLFGDRADGERYSLCSVNGSGFEGYGVSFVERNYHEEHYFREEEQTAFNTQGKVITADGRELSFNLGFEMSRTFEESTNIQTSAIEAVMCDPLVINLDTTVASVSDQKILFDLDADGTEDRISRLNAGSGYLSLDLNDDGTINDGSELFGTSSGDGFRDLARFDSDGNGWIDEADDIFDKLRICVFDENGEQKLYRLKEKDVGAIYLGNVSTGFSLNEQGTNKVNAAIRKTGIFLYENGAAGTVQHLDLAKDMSA